MPNHNVRQLPDDRRTTGVTQRHCWWIHFAWATNYSFLWAKMFEEGKREKGENYCRRATAHPRPPFMPSLYRTLDQVSVRNCAWFLTLMQTYLAFNTVSQIWIYFQPAELFIKIVSLICHQTNSLQSTIY